MTDDQFELCEEIPEEDYAEKKRRIIKMLFAYSVIVGVVTVFLPEEDPFLDLVIGLPLLGLTMSWCFADADERDRQIGGFTKGLLVLIFFLGFPLYVFQSRGIKGFKTLCLAILLVAAMFVCMVASMFLTLIVGEALGLVNPNDFDW